HSDARLVPRSAAGAIDGYSFTGSHRRGRCFRQRGHQYAHPRSYGETHQRRVSLMGSGNVIPLDEKMESRGAVSRGNDPDPGPGADRRYQLIVIVIAALVFIGCIISPPSLMDDVDAVQAQIAHNMLQSGDWVTARLDGVAYLEKSPLKYWMIAV